MILVTGSEARLLAAGLVASATALLAHAFLEDNLAFAPRTLQLGFRMTF